MNVAFSQQLELPITPTRTAYYVNLTATNTEVEPYPFSRNTLSSRIHVPTTRSYYVQFTQQMYIRTKSHRTYTEQDDFGTIHIL